jgi:hypothetical protein
MTNFKIVFAILLLAVFLPARFAGAAGEANQPWLRKAVFGLFVHDRGPTSDQHESGVDPNWELQWNPPQWRAWNWIGSPIPTAGVTPNFNGHTSVFYGGLTYELNLSNRFTDDLTYNLTRSLFVAGSVSAALHDGPLHKNPAGCKERSDCGFGYRVLPRLAIELGTNFSERHGVSFFYDHMSHKHILPGENEGVDHIGIRYHFNFNGSSS